MDTLIHQRVPVSGRAEIAKHRDTFGILWPPTALYISSQRDFITSYHVTLEKLPSVYDTKHFGRPRLTYPKLKSDAAEVWALVTRVMKMGY